MFPKDIPWRSRKYLDWVKTLPCCHCRQPADDPHHIKIRGVGGTSLTTPDFTAMPLCRDCHDRVGEAPWEWPQTKWMIETLNQAFAEGRLP